MKALRYHGPGDLRLDDIDQPVCAKNQVKVRKRSKEKNLSPLVIYRWSIFADVQKLKPEFVGICGTGLNAQMPIHAA